MASRYVFAKMLYHDGFIDDIMYKIYESMFNPFIELYNPTHMIYLHVEPEICYNRITKRQRDGENSISIEYLQKCQDYYNDWIENENFKLPILRITGNEDAMYQVGDDTDIGNVWVQQVITFIEEQQQM